jgi:hypothetical protein
MEHLMPGFEPKDGDVIASCEHLIFPRSLFRPRKYSYLASPPETICGFHAEWYVLCLPCMVQRDLPKAIRTIWQEASGNMLPSPEEVTA